MLPPPLRARLVLLIVYVATTTAAPPINTPPKSTFAIASTPGSAFSGRSVNHDSARTANLDDPDAVTALAPDESIGSATHDLPATYGFTQPRAGDDSIGPSNPFIYVGVEDTPKDLDATVEGIANDELSRNLVVPWHVHDKRARGRTEELSSGSPRIQGCSDLQEQAIKSFIGLSQELLKYGISALRTPGSSSESRANFVLWFGEYSESRSHTVLNNLGRISGHLSFSGFTIQCGGCNEELGYPARLVPRDRLIQICTPFWTGSRPGELGILYSFAGLLVPLHKHTTGRVAARIHALTAPMEVLTNVDNYVAYILMWPDPIQANEYPPPLYNHPPSYDPPPYNGRRDYEVSNSSSLPM